MNQREQALTWWRGQSETDKRTFAAKYYPDKEFLLVDMSSSYVEFMHQCVISLEREIREQYKRKVSYTMDTDFGDTKICVYEHQDYDPPILRNKSDMITRETEVILSQHVVEGKTITITKYYKYAD